MDKRKMRIYAGMMAAALLLGGCGSSGGAARTTAAETETAETTAAETTAKETEASDSAEKEESTEAEETIAGETAEAAETTAGETTEAAETAAEETTAPVLEQIGEDVAGLLDGIYERINNEVGLNSSMIVPDDFITNYYGIDVTQLEEYLFSMSEMATSAETVIIMKVDELNRQSTIDSLQMVLEQKAAEMENYLPDQFDIVSKSSVKEIGDYVYLVISENAEAIKDIIEAELQ